ncbi:MAG: hypothetical protein ACRDFS_05620, partial [Chloroflexota bacterium]
MPIRRLALVLPCLPLIVLLGGCGGKANAVAPTKTPVKHVVRTPAPTPLVETATPVPVAPTIKPTAKPTSKPTATPRPKRTATTVPAAATLLSASLSPSSVSPGATLHASARTSGGVRAVSVYLSSGPGGILRTYSLAESSAGTWDASIAAPSTTGTYHYTVGLYPDTGNRRVIDNNGWNVQVGSGSSGGNSGGAQSLPANLPTAPPFSYSNPVPATFTAEGRSIQGSEVISDTRTDVPASSVSNFYEDHLPRSGWSVDGST